MSGPLILVVEDEQVLRTVLSRMLAPLGYEVALAADGVQALAMAGARTPELILLDVQMPRKNGWEVLADLRRDPATRMIPVIMLTGAVAVEDRVSGLTLGADDYVTKPFSPEELAARVQGLLRRNRLALGANPLTGLPGTPALEEEVGRRIKEGLPFALFHADLDRFKSYNDTYGFERGDETIRGTAACLREAVAGGFLSHIGGDDFAAVVHLEDAQRAAGAMTDLFDLRAPGFYPVADAGRSPLMTLSVGAASTARRAFSCYAEAAAAASEMKAYLKARPSSVSRFAFDRRGARPA